MSGARFQVEFLNDAAQKDYIGLDGSVRAMCNKGLARLALRADEIGKPLSGDLKGCKELKYKADGPRIIYRIKDGVVQIVQVIAIGARGNDKVFKLATKRLQNGGEDGSKGIH